MEDVRVEGKVSRDSLRWGGRNGRGVLYLSLSTHTHAPVVSLGGKRGRGDFWNVFGRLSGIVIA